MTKILKIILFWFPAALYLALIYYFSSISNHAFIPNMPDYLLHVLEYFVLSILIVRAFNFGLRRRVTMFAFTSSIIFSVIYAALDEIHQLYVPGRHASLLDFVSDGAGIIIGIVFIYLAQRCFGVCSRVAEKIPGSE